MVWYVSVDVTVTIDYHDIEADTKEEAIQIAKQRVQEGIDYNNCDAAISDMDVFVSEKRWENNKKYLEWCKKEHANTRERTI